MYLTGHQGQVWPADKTCGRIFGDKQPQERHDWVYNEDTGVWALIMYFVSRKKTTKHFQAAKPDNLGFIPKVVVL